MKADVALVAEAGPLVGTGHLVESLTIVSELQARGLRPILMVPPEAPEDLVARAGVQVERLPALDPIVLAEVGQRLIADGVRLVVTDLREVSDDQVMALSKAGLRVTCIDEFGGRRLSCAAVINPSPVTRRHRYTSGVRGFRVYAGPKYLALSSEYIQCHSVPRHFSSGIHSVIISMGGVDRTGATLRIAEALRGYESDAERHIVMGAGFQRAGELEGLVIRAPGPWRIHRNLPCLANLLAAADVGFTAGGNTLCELACVGTPALVLYEDEHEAEQGRAFEAKGFGFCLGAGVEVSGDSIREVIGRLEDPLLRRAQSEAGKALVDGQGASRICQIVEEHLSVDSSIAAGSPGQ
jgi:spore coat polysaccharide biosynthesis predicted glycosyltransferase SpsG